MGKLHKTIRKLTNKHGMPTLSPSHDIARALLGKDLANKLPQEKALSDFHDKHFDEAHPIGKEMERQYDARKEAEAAATAAENEPVIPLPDEEELARARRRRARRGTGRSSTVLTDQERFGL